MISSSRIGGCAAISTKSQSFSTVYIGTIHRRGGIWLALPRHIVKE
jgi:hypothetical protein